MALPTDSDTTDNDADEGSRRNPHGAPRTEIRHRDPKARSGTPVRPKPREKTPATDDANTDGDELFNDLPV